MPMKSALDLSRFDRRVYTPGPTPLEPMPKLSEVLGSNVNLWIKRDDMLGLTGGGNKTRKLEYVMADAMKHGADTIVTCGAVQSNHCRLTLSACNKEGLSCCLVIEERVPGSYDADASGNNYLFRLLGAERIVRVGPGEAPAAVEKTAEELRAEGRNVYCIPGGASDEIGAMGYVACAHEIQKQIEGQGLTIDAMVCASGSGGTHAGLTVGLLESDIDLVGISTRHPKDRQHAHIHSLAERTYRHIANDPSYDLPAGAVAVNDGYVGRGYSLPTEGMEEAVAIFARSEGILLDPVYTGKAAAGLIDLVRRGEFREGSNILFLHTGGAPSLYHYQPLLVLATGRKGEER